MARTKNEIVDEQFTLQESISNAAQGFARQILQILGSATMTDLSALRERAPPGNGTSARAVDHKVEQPAPRVERAAEEDEGETEVLDKAAEDRILKEALAVEMPKVACPVQGCHNPGIRPKRNFCLKHSRELTKAEQIKLREQQKKRRLRDETKGGAKKK